MDTLRAAVRFFQVHAEDHTVLPIVIPRVGRHTLASFFNYAGFKNGAEIGVEQGAFSKTLCDRIEGLHLYCVDPWQHYNGYRDHVNQEKLDKFFLKTQKKLAVYDTTIIRAYSTEAAKQVPDKSLDFVYIDANHDFYHVAEDLNTWIPKVRSGGIVAGHDYMITKANPTIKVKFVVDAFTQAHDIKPWFVVGEDEEGKAKSFFWVVS